MKIIGFDFSIEKPACCIYNNGNYTFKSWAWGLSANLKNVYQNANVEIIERPDVKLSHNDVSEKMQNDVNRGIIVADLIANSFYKGELTEDPDTWIIWEGLSFASSGNVALQLGGYKYLAMDRLRDVVEIEKQLTYAPTTIKKTAGCSVMIPDPKRPGKKKAQGKPEMIQAFLDSKNDIFLKEYIILNRDYFRKRGDNNWIDHLDDLVDSYWLVQTFIEKEMDPLFGKSLD